MIDKTQETTIKRALTIEDFERAQFPEIQISEDWQPHLGEPQLGNSHWIVYGGSGHGKTSYVLQIVKMLCRNGQKVHYNTGEEGMKKSFKMALKRNNLASVKSHFKCQQENYEQLTKRLSKKRQPKIVVIDSVQYLFRGLNASKYFEFINKFKDTTFIWISAADGNKPKGKIAEDIQYDADIVINVKNFEAIVEKNRFEAYENRIIYKQGYNERNLILLQRG